MTTETSELRNFFFPSSIAIVGASENVESWGTRYIQSLHDFGYKGKICAINRSGDEVLGLKIYRSVLDVPDSIDLVAVCIAARFVPEVLQDCLKKGIKAAIVLSAGFSEIGDEGRALEAELVKVAEGGIRVLGPNCFGAYCPKGNLTILPGSGFPRDGGSVAFIAQSGQLSETTISRSIGEGIRFSKAVSYGNACNTNESDLLDYLTKDEDTKIIGAYIEGVRDGRNFFEIVRNNTAKKPILIWKGGMTRSGAVAAASHTGSMASSSEVWNSFYRQSKAIKIESIEELIDTMAGFSCFPTGGGRRIALISGGGAGGVVSADACEKAGLLLPSFSSEIDAQLRTILPAVGVSARNPVDIGGPHPPLKLLRSVLEAVASSEEVDIIVIRRIFFSVKIAKFYGGAAAPSFEEQDELLEIPLEIKKKYGKQVVIIQTEDLTGIDALEMESERRKVRDYFFTHGVPVYSTEGRAFAAIAHMAEFKENAGIDRDADDYRIPSPPDKKKVESTLAKIAKTAKSDILNEVECKGILKEAGIDIIETLTARNREEAISVGEKLGFPVAMKIISPQVTHKSDSGGVKLGIGTPEEAGNAYDDILKSIKSNVPDAVIEGVSVQKMAPAGIELVIGMTKDPHFGPMLMFGLGGIFVEILKDVSFRIVPLTRADAREMIREIKGYPLLEGYRGQSPVDVSYLEELLLKISRFVEENPEIKEMDINPLIAYSDGAVAADARIVLEGV